MDNSTPANDEETNLQSRRDGFIARIRSARTHVEALAVLREVELGWYWCARRIAASEIISAAEKMKR